MREHRHVAIIVLIALLVACAPAATPTPAPTPTPVATPTPAITPTPLPEGKVSVGKYGLFYRCSGDGSPTVVVEAGFGMAGAGSDWDATEAGVSKVTRICVYDRATLGRSSAQPAVRTAKGVAEDLHRLLQDGHIGGPYVLVGHSLGGWFVRVYAGTYPDEVVGMVLVDATPPDWLSREMAVLPAQSAGEPSSVTQYRRNEQKFLGHTVGNLGEKLNIAASATEAGQVTTLGDMPLVVLVATMLGITDLPGDVDAKIGQLWLDMQIEQSRLSSNGSVVLATQSFHSIQGTEPQLVIDAILKVVEEARKR